MTQKLRRSHCLTRKDKNIKQQLRRRAYERDVPGGWLVADRITVEYEVLAFALIHDDALGLRQPE